MRVLGLVVVYLIGSIPVGFLISRMAGGVDIRGQGSGSIGATNVLRTMGPAPAIATLLGDVLKGYLAVRVAEVFGPQPGWGAAGAVLAIVGNCWPIFLRFKGGKGVATGLGAFLALAPKAIVPAFGSLARAHRGLSLRLARLDRGLRGHGPQRVASWLSSRLRGGGGVRGRAHRVAPSCQCEAAPVGYGVAARSARVRRMMARSSAVAVVGAGSWGTALALQIGRRGTPVRLWARDAALAASMASMRENTRYLPGVRLPEGVLATADHREALRDVDLVILAMPSHFVRDALTPMAADITPGAALLSATKGLEPVTALRMSELLAELLPDHAVAALSGPSFAREVALGRPTASWSPPRTRWWRGDSRSVSPRPPSASTRIATSWAWSSGARSRT